ncbi:MAG: nucleotide pyrophosphohydrolase [Ruminococcaceae bacterium]|nr:nucleotide pyrophosphohydrolase [Oscillospiraceae bacterium]
MKDNSYLKNLIENMDESTSLKQLQDYVEDMVNIRGFADETPQDCLLLLTEELGELAKEVRKNHTHIKNDTAKNNKSDLNGEIGDVLMMLLALCRTLDVDLLQAFREKELINCGRNWK